MRDCLWIRPQAAARGHGRFDCDRRPADDADASRDGVTSVVGVRLLLALVLTGAVSLAQADVCSARFFHDGGSIEIAGTGMLTVSAHLSFSKVRKSSAEVCQAQVNGQASYGLMGLFGGTTDVNHLMRVNGAKTTFVESGKAPAQAPATVDLGMLSLFGYGAAISTPGQRLPAQSFRVALGDPGRGPTTPLTVRTGERTVGKRETIDTALGRLSCWPVRYNRNTEPTMANVRNVQLMVPAIQSQVTDWYCPASNLVMRQEIDQGGQRSLIEVKSVK